MSAPRVSWFESALAAVAPGWAVHRAAARMNWLSMTRAYDAARHDRRSAGIAAPATGPNAEAGPALGVVRQRARALVRNNPYAKAAVRRFAAALVGTGVTARLSTSRFPEAARALAAWEQFCKHCDPQGQQDFAGLQAQIAAALMESGEVLLRLIPQRVWSKLIAPPLKIELLEGDFLDAAKSGQAEDGHVIVQGVEFRPDGTRAAYWLFDGHPGEMFGSYGPAGGGGLMSRRVEARFVRHVALTDRPGQVRGVSPFAPVVMRLYGLAEYDDAQLMAKKVQASLAVFRQRPAGPVASSLVTKTDTQGRAAAKLSPGMIYDAEPGETVSFLTPGQVNDYAPFSEAQLRAVAVGLGLPYEALTGDLSKVNYSSLRAGMIAFWEWIEQIQWTVLAPQVLNPLWAAVMESMALAVPGFPVKAADWQPDWAMPKRRWVDPLKDVLAEKEAIRSGLKSLPAALAELGEEPDAVLRDIAASNARLDELKIILDTDPRRGGATDPALAAMAAQDAPPRTPPRAD